MIFLTMTNSGGVNICKNMLHSAKNIGLNLDNFIIACLDVNAYDYMKEYKGAFLYDKTQSQDYQNHSFEETSSFRQIVKNKWPIIKQIYKKHKNLCWIDCDIVFKQNPLSILESLDRMAFQSDHPGMSICSGFMVFNPQEICNNLIEECSKHENEDDQIILNKKLIREKKYWTKFKILEEELFPNGYTYYEKNKKENAIIVHNNWVIGIEQKIKKFKEENLWVLN